jgi:hypothetical protein
MVNFLVAKRETAILTLMLAVSFLVRFLLFPQQGYPIDTNDFTSWSTQQLNMYKTFTLMQDMTIHPSMSTSSELWPLAKG